MVPTPKDGVVTVVAGCLKVRYRANEMAPNITTVAAVVYSEPCFHHGSAAVVLVFLGLKISDCLPAAVVLPLATKGEWR